MFLNLGKFEKEVKRAYKDRSILIGMLYDKKYDADVLMFWTAGWAVYIDSNYLANKVKALVVELIGDIPKPGQIVEVSKSLPFPQLQVFDPMYEKRLEERWLVTNKLVATDILLDEAVTLRLFQDSASKEVFAFDVGLLAMVDPHEADLDTESMPIGPCRIVDDSSLTYWFNEVGTVVMAPWRTKNKEIIEALKSVSLKQEEEGAKDETELSQEYEELTLSQNSGQDDSEG